jgi:hypothetical protein
MLQRLARHQSLALCFLFLSQLLSAAANAALFDFESETATFTGGARTGALTSLSLTDAGLTINISRPSSGFDIVDNTVAGQTGKPPTWGARSLDPFFNSGGASFLINFSQALSSFAVEFGDFGGDSVDNLVLQAFSGANGTGTLLASSSTPYSALTFPGFATASVTASGINSITMIGGTPSFVHSVFYDNIVAAVQPAVGVPEPTSGLLIAVALAALVVAHTIRRQR